jgi:hypothetical protein
MTKSNMKNQTNTPKQLARASAERQKVLEDQRRVGPGVTPLSVLVYGLNHPEQSR